MTLTEIHQRLAKEFPERYITFSIAVSNGQVNPVSIQIYDDDFGALILCSNLDDGINQLKLKLGIVQPEMEIAI